MGGLVGLLLSAQLGVSVAPFAQAAPQQRQTGASAAGDRVALETLVGEMQDQLESLKRALDQTSAEVAAQRVLIDDLRHGRENAPVVGTPGAVQAVGEAQKSGDPELPQRFVAAGDFPGSIAIPGTNTAFRIGGQARSTYVHSLTPLGEDDRFVTSSIPVDDSRPGDQRRVTYTAAPSRLNFDMRSPEPFGATRTFVEFDFSGSGNAAHLRHAFIQGRRWLFGQTWSTFSDPEAQPTDIDFEGLNAISLFRQPQIRYSWPLRESLTLSAAVENPAPDLTGAAGVNLTPDLVARLRWDPATPASGLINDVAHIQGAILFRTLRGAPADQPQTTLTTPGIGVTVSGVVLPKFDRAGRVKFATNDGWGIGRYVKDLEAEGGQDAVYDPIRGQLRALAMASGYLGYEHQWRAWLQSGVTYGFVGVSNLDIQPDSALRRTQRGSIYFTWLPVKRSELIGEFLFGERVNRNGDRGTASQFQLGWKLTY